MKKTFLKAAAAAMVMAATVALSSVAAFAAEQKVTWSYEDTPTVPEIFGFVDDEGSSTLSETGTMSSSRKGLFTEAIFDDDTVKEFKNKTGYNLNSSKSTDAIKSSGDLYGSKYSGFTPQRSGKILFYIGLDNSNDKTEVIKFYNSTASETYPGKYLVDATNGIISSHDLPNRDSATSVDAIELDVTAGNRYYIYANSKSYLFRMVFVYDDEETSNTVNGATDGDAAIIKDADNTYYAVVIVSETAAQETDKLTVTAGSNSIEIDTVYDSVVIDGTTYTADQIGGVSGDYVSGIKLTINNGNGKSAADIQKAITVA